MNNVYCTLFDSFYLSRGLLMIESLIQHGNTNDRIYVFCFDEKTFEVLSQLKLAQVIPISLSEFETDTLKAVKATRSKGEYCWTCTPHVLLHVLQKRGEKECTYLDADLYFYHNPSEIIPTSSDELVHITEHRYQPEYDQSATSGRFCVQFVTFKNEPRSMKLLEQWGHQCLEWCYARHEPGKFGDQMYLDAWPAQGAWVKISDDRRVGVAPWNIQSYSLQEFKAFFYHFHEFKWISDGNIDRDRFDLGGYKIHPWVKKTIYFPYTLRLLQKSLELKDQFGVPLPRASAPTGFNFVRLKFLLKKWFKPNNVICLRHLS